MIGLVIGAGPIGTMAGMWLRINGCESVYIADIDSQKLEIVREYGLIPIDSKESQPDIFLKESCGGVDCSLEAVGIPATYLQTLNSLKSGGQAVFLGNIKGEFKIGERDFSQILRKQLEIKGSWNSSWVPHGGEWKTALTYMARRI